VDKKQKYYKYIVDTLLNGTKFNHENDKIQIPWIKGDNRLRDFKNAGEHDTKYSQIIGFETYMKNKFGVNDSELQMLWSTYLSRFVEKMNQ